MRCAYYQNVARFLSDTPANLLTPRLLCEYAHKIGTEAGLDVISHDEKYIRKKDMNLFLSVSAGSIEPPMYLTAEYNGRPENSNKNDSKKNQNTTENKSLAEQKAFHVKSEPLARDENFAFDICLIGKGVTFDSGGISLKPSCNMSDMKGDMQGAAASFRAACLVADQKLYLNLLVEIPLTENMPGSKATKPGDVKKAMNSLTVEIDNTDAEGRLILADALTHAHKKNPRIIIDTATLTGAMRVALGGVYAGLFTRNDDLASEIIQSGIEAKDKVWIMPLTEEYENDFRLEIAHLKNMGERGSAGSTAGAEFLRRFVQSKNWAHIDIASTMTKAEPRSIFAKGMSGRGTLLLYKICERLSRN